ncbi:hypothetical protein AJ80_04911 [Polytolypa hystricis UAMH7299]|uniref:RBR-type E3 ubiquitin transferase n=1 Tax=Polytolypa hystricis (strain UAMH7299) TaxID=1447883 RepID=A0A2B7Y842_POLH7|nr:hypothetical protein AJ80_04911 [Polytolypa hystricis UAMH7299]
MEEDSTISDDERAIELETIAAIYPEITIDPLTNFKASLDIPVSPSTHLKVRFRHNFNNNSFHAPATPANSYPTPPTSDGKAAGDERRDNRPDADEDQEVYELSHLPPLSLRIELPNGYPFQKSPNFTISTNPAWLPQSRVTQLIADGERLWEEMGKDQVVFAYIDHLQQSAEDVFALSDHVDSDESIVTFSRDLKIALLDFDIKAKRERFEQGTFECGVCLEPKKGAHCHRLLLCSHVFCIKCLQNFYNSCIQEGVVDNVKCLAPDCGKDLTPPATDTDQPPRRRRKRRDRTLNPSELLQIPLEQEVVQRYVELKRKRKLESDKTTIYCPRQWCQGAARSKRYPKPTDPINDDALELSSDDDDDDGPAPFDPQGDEDQLPPVSERLAVCEDCSYAFCSVCRKGWHGELVRCCPKREAELSAAEKATQEYIEQHTARCPTCDTRCQKSMGCNHMICFQCKSHFCYLCSSWLTQDNPYQHYNTVDSECYMRLWELEGGDDSNEPPEWDIPLEELVETASEDGSDDDNDDSDDDDDDGPEWEFAGESDTDDEHDHPHPPPPAPIPPRVAPLPHQNGNHQENGDEAVRAAAAERQAQVEAIAQARRGRERQNNNNNNNNNNARRRRQQQQQQQQQQEQEAQAQAPPPIAARQAQAQVRNLNNNNNNNRPAAQGVAGPAAAAQGRQIAGLQRFLDLVQNDMEDEWDSDELEDF